MPTTKCMPTTAAGRSDSMPPPLPVYCVACWCLMWIVGDDSIRYPNMNCPIGVQLSTAARHSKELPQCSMLLGVPGATFHESNACNAYIM